MEHMVAIKSETDEYFEVEGRAIPFDGPFEGGKDHDGERFSHMTDYCLDWFPTGRPLLFHHGHVPGVETEVVGRQVEHEVRDDGVWAKTQVYKRHPLAQRIRDLVEQGKLWFSSGAVWHLKRVLRDGTITRWPWIELSLTETPANPYAIAMPAAKANFEAAGIELDIPTEDAESGGGQESVREETPDAVHTITSEVTEMEANELESIINGALDKRDAAQKAKEDEKARTAQAEAEFKARVDAEVKAALEKQLQPNKIAGAMGEVERPTGIQVLSKYDKLDPVTLDFLAWGQGQMKSGWSEQLRNCLATKMKDRGSVYGRGYKEYEGNSLAVKAITAMDTADTSNWVPDLWEAELWRKVRLENQVAALLRNIDLPSDSYQFPTESTDPTVYKVAQFTGASDPSISGGATPSAAADTKLTLTTSKLGAQVWVSGELEEDNVFPILPLLRDQMGRKMGDAVEFVCFSGDTATGAANVSDATPAATNKIVLDDGWRKYCLVTATGQASSVGALTVDDLIAIRKLCGKGAVKPSNLVYFCDYETYLGKLLALDELITVDKYGPNATLVTGELGRFMGIPVVVSENLDKTGTNGKEISGGTTGNILCVVRDRWIIGWRRRMKFEQQRWIGNDATQLVASCRMAFGGFNETDGTDVALGYNVTLT